MIGFENWVAVKCKTSQFTTLPWLTPNQNTWVDFAADHDSSGRGFQISFLTIDGE